MLSLYLNLSRKFAGNAEHCDSESWNNAFKSIFYRDRFKELVLLKFERRRLCAENRHLVSEEKREKEANEIHYKKF